MSVEFFKSNEWCSQNGYLTIDCRLFSRYLCELFNRFLGGYHYYQEFKPVIETDKERPIYLQGKEERNLVIISTNKENDYSKKRIVNRDYLGLRYLEPVTIETKSYLTLFSKYPIKLGDSDFLIYFGSYDLSYVKVCLGSIENGIFIPNKFAFPLVSSLRYGNEKEIYDKNPNYSFIEDFMKELFNYKVSNRKPDLDESDMELILLQFGISRKEKREALLRTLRGLKEETTQILLSNSSVESTLKLVNK